MVLVLSSPFNAIYLSKVIRGRAGPTDETPIYDDTRPLDRILLGLFRSKVAEEIGGDVYEPGYDGLMKMIRVLNEKYPSKRQTQEASRCVCFRRAGISRRTYRGFKP